VKKQQPQPKQTLPPFLVIFAFRYALGRMSTAPSDVCDYLRANWASLDEPTRKLIQRELEAAFTEDDRHRADYPEECQSGRPLGWDCDRYTWELVRQLWKEGVA
jgi:hypothetical protein